MKDKIESMILKWKRGLYSTLDCWECMKEWAKDGLLTGEDWKYIISIVGDYTIG